MSFSENAWKIFNQAINDYHTTDSVDSTERNPFPENTLEHLLYAKNWIDTVQWHLEDLIRDAHIDPAAALLLKRRIDSSNQKRTDLVEFIDAWFMIKFKDLKTAPNARINTETPAWAVDRLSILALKIYHMAVEAGREGAEQEHRLRCQAKLDVLHEQKDDLCTSIDRLLHDIENGEVKMKLYKQMKMYNDESLNPILYQNAKK